MGMFDYVDFEMSCPDCGALLKDWQSKDRECNLEILPVTTVEHLMTSCDTCYTSVHICLMRPIQRPPGCNLKEEEEEKHG